MLSEIFQAITDVIFELGYLGILLLMALESSCFPFPSEIVLIPAGYLAFTGEMNIFIVILCGILGSILGAIFNYVLAMKFGKVLLQKYGKYLFISEAKIIQAEQFFYKHGAISTFIGRLIPIIRQYISLVSGFAKMPFISFIFFTTLGVSIWVAILSLLGYFIGQNQALIEIYLNQIMIILAVILILVLAIYIKFKKI